MVRIDFGVDLAYRIHGSEADFIFNIHPARTACQAVWAEQLSISQPIDPHLQTDPTTGNRFMRLKAGAGDLLLSYRATIDIEHHRSDPAQLLEQPIERLPLSALGYIYPSRYCESDKLMPIAMKQFANLPQGHRRVEAIVGWVQRQISYCTNTSGSKTSALETLVDQVGVCRDFAHLMIALCRAINIPARFATGTDFGADPARPPDFHAYVEVYLGERWYIFDPAGAYVPMGFIRIGTGRDAADVAIATIFGDVEPVGAPAVRATAVDEPALGFEPPFRTTFALSTSAIETAGY